MSCVCLAIVYIMSCLLLLQQHLNTLKGYCHSITDIRAHSVHVYFLCHKKWPSKQISFLGDNTILDGTLTQLDEEKELLS